MTFAELYGKAAAVGRSALTTMNQDSPLVAGTTARTALAATLGFVSRFVDDIRQARAAGRLGDRFRPDDVRRACPGWADHTYGVFLPKHRQGNPAGYTPYFYQNRDGTYSLLP